MSGISHTPPGMYKKGLPMLQLKKIRKEYKTGDLVQTALNDVSLNLRDSEFVAILGPSGSGTLLWFSRRLSEILDPYLVVLNSLPKSALAPLLIVWLGATKTTIIVAGMSVAIFGSILNLYTSFMTVDPGKLKLIYTLGGNRRHALLKVVLPFSLPAIISNMKVNIGLCLVGVIIGEFLAAREGLGYLIIYASQVFKMDWLLMSILLLCLMATLLYSLINLLERWCRKHY